MEFKPKPFWWRHFRPITQDDHGKANTALLQCEACTTNLCQKVWSTQLHKIVIQTKKLQIFIAILNRAPFISGPEMKEPRSGNNRLLPTVKKRSHTNRPESDRTGPNPLTNQKRFSTTNQNWVFWTNQVAAFFALTKYYWSVTNTYDWSISTNQKITLIIFWLAKNGKDKIRTPHWSKK